MSSQPPVVRRPNEFGSAGDSPLPPPLQSGNKTANYLVGCFGLLILGFVILLGAAALVIRGTSVSSRQKIEASRPDVEQTGSLPSELRKAISEAGSANNGQTENVREWGEADQQKLETLLELLENQDVEAIDMDRLVEELSRLAPLAVLPFTEALWTSNLKDVIIAPELTGGIKCIDVRWISETEARAILIAPNYDIQSLMIVYLHDSDGELKVYDWRETLEPMSEVEYWAYYAILDEPECYAYGELVEELDQVYYDETIEESVRAARLLAIYRKTQMPSKWRGLAQNVTATYLHFAEDSQTEMQVLSQQMNPAAFAGAYLWQARMCRVEDPKRAFQLAMKAMDAVSWHPAATDIVLATIEESGNDSRRAGAWIAQSLQHDTLRGSQRLLSSDAAVIESVVEILFKRCSSAVASERLLNLVVGAYASEVALEKLDAALDKVSPSDLLVAYIRYSQAKQTGSEEAEFAALREVVKYELPGESREMLLQDYVSMAGTTGELLAALATLEASGFYDGDEIESILANAIISLEPGGDWQYEVALERLDSESTMVQAARAILLDKLEQPEKAFVVLLEMWPDREAELVDVDNYYDLDYTNAATELLSRLAIELKREDEFIERCDDKSVAAAVLANARFSTGDIEGLRRFLLQVEQEVPFRPYYEAYCELVLTPETAAQSVASGLEWILDNAGEDEFWPELDFVWATAPLYGEVGELRYALVQVSVEAGIMPEVLDALSPSTRLLIVTEDLSGLFSETSDRQQLLDVLDRVRKIENEDVLELQRELETRVRVMGHSLKNAARAKIAELEAMEYRYTPMEHDLVVFLTEIGRIDLVSEILNEVTPDLRSDEYDDWKRLGEALKQKDGEAIRESPVLARLSWTDSLPMIDALSQAGALVSASEESCLTFGFNVPSVLLRLRGDWQSLESEAVEGFSKWNRVETLERFPTAIAVWTLKDDAGHWTAAVYHGIPPGIDTDELPESVDASSHHLLICNCPSPGATPKELAVHRYVLSSLSNWDAVSAVYTPASAVSWPEEDWQPAMAQYVENGKLNIRWMNFSEGWSAHWLKYVLRESRNDDVSKYNFGGIVENIPRERLTQQESGRGSGVNATYDMRPTHKLLQPSICFPALKAGVYVR